MKKLFLSLALIAAATSAGAQQNAQQAAEAAAKTIAETPRQDPVKEKPKYWTKSIRFDLGINQTSLTNWAAGGFNTLNITTGLDASANYKKDLSSWTNRLQLQYGLLTSEEKKDLVQTSTDRIYLESKYAYKTSKESKWSYAASLDFRSQFSNGYKYNTPKEGQTWAEAATLKSGFFSPAYLNLGVGMDWDPNDWLDINFSPITGGITFAQIESLRKSYGMELREGMEDLPQNYKSARFLLGAQIKANLKLKINDNFGYETQLVLFSDYLDHPLHLRVNWDNKISWQLTKFFNLGLSTWLIYDPKVLIADDKGVSKHRVQFKEFITFNFTWTLK